jgi:transcription antitermination protein NusB
MGTRRRARELALQALYYMDASGCMSLEVFEKFSDNFPPGKKSELFFNRLVEGIIREKDRIDTLIEHSSSNWRLSRMTLVDRNIIRVAVYEMLYCKDIPPKVSINEAVDIGKRFGTEESGAFINGIVDSIRMALEHGEIA